MLPAQEDAYQPTMPALPAPGRKRRGRPRAPLRDPTPCPLPFDEVATQLVSLLPREWMAAKDRARQLADRDPTLTPRARRVLGFLAGHINRSRGFDWHSAAAIAADLCMTVRTVERSFAELTECGYILRRHETHKGSKSSRRWATTLPAMLAANDPTENAVKDPTKKAEGPDELMQQGPDQNVGRILKENLEKEHSPLAPRRRRGTGEVSLLDEVTRAKPHCSRAFDELLRPLLSRLPLNAPDPSAALGSLAELAEAHSDDVLAEALRLLTKPGGERCRHFDVRPTNIEAALARAQNIVDCRRTIEQGPLLWRGTRSHAEALRLVEAHDPPWAEVLRHEEFVRRSALRRYGVPQLP